MDGLVTLVMLIAALAFIIFIIWALLYAARYRKAGPNELLVISGRAHTVVSPLTGKRETVGFRLVKGGGTFVFPIIERVDSISLEVLSTHIAARNVYTLHGVPVNLELAVQVKIKSDEYSLYLIAEQLLSKKREEVEGIATQVIEGHLRAVLGTMTVEEVYQDRDTFTQRVREVSAKDLGEMGLSILALTVKEIGDEQGYLQALGQARVAEVKRNAKMAQAQANRDAEVASTQASREAALENSKTNQETEQAKYAAAIKVAATTKDYQMQKAAFEEEMQRKRGDAERARAEAELAFNLQSHITQQQIKSEEMQVQVIERMKEQEVAQHEIKRKEKELTATVEKPAEAEKYRIETLAEARRIEREKEAAGEAEAARFIAQAEVESIRLKAQADADAIKIRSLAQAEMIREQGAAEADVMRQKAEVAQEFTQTVLLQQMIDAMPRMAEILAEPLSKVERIVVIGGDSGGAGTHHLAQDVNSMIAQVPETLKALTGIDLVQSLRDLPAVKTEDENGAEE